MANWYDETAEELSNAEAHRLLRDIGYGYVNERVDKVSGRNFHASIRYFNEQSVKNDCAHVWITPDEKHKLAVDDIIKDLIQKKLFTSNRCNAR